MICPVKTCHSDIDDDSLFCDQCGAELLICPKCSRPGVGKFCGKDGIELVPRRKCAAPSADTAVLSQRAGGNTKPPAAAPDNGRTGNIIMPGSSGNEAVIFVHSSGAEFTLRNNDILGRTEGAHAAELSGFRFVSRKHATVFKDNGVWCIRDHEATNKTQINGTILEPERAYPIKQGDTIHLADQEFTVK